MARSSIEDIKDIFETDLTDAQIHSFLNLANRFVTANLAGQGLSDDELKDIELLLSCHFAALRDVRTSQESIGGEWSFRVQGETGMNLDATFYGQQAKLLDSTGTLDRLGANMKKATINVLGDVN